MTSNEYKDVRPWGGPDIRFIIAWPWSFRLPTILGAIGLTAAIFCIVTATAFTGLSALYGVVIALVSRYLLQRQLIGAAVGCSALTLVSAAIYAPVSMGLAPLFGCAAALAVIAAATGQALGAFARRAVQAESDPRIEKIEARFRNIFQAAGIALWEINFAAAARRIEEALGGDEPDLAIYFEKHPEFIREIMKLTIAVDVNDACMRMHGATSKDQLLGPVDKVWPPEGEAAFAQAVIIAMQHAPFFQTDTVLRTLDGRLLDVLYSTAYPPETASLECLYVAFTDITARNRAQSELQRLQADLAHSTRLTSLGELTASLAHEINQPLGGALSNSQAALRFLRRDQPDVGAAIDAIASAVDETRRAGNVLGGIRALAKKTSGEAETICLNSIIKETLPLLRRALDEAGVELRTQLDPALSAVRADRVQIQQVLINLMMNAVQAMDHDLTSVRRLVVSTSADAGSAVVAVADSGPGIPGDLRDRLFTAFVTTREDGMGLGLSLCASIIGRHEGRIWADPDRTSGAKFIFSLPALEHSEA